MAKGLKAFRLIQISNPENTPGTAEAAVEALCAATLSIPMGDKVIHYPDNDCNGLSRNKANDFIVGRQVDGTLEGELNTRLAIWLLSNAIRGNITPTQPAATLQPNAYLWTFEPGLTTGNTPDIANGIDTFTIEYGDNIQGYESAFMFTRTLTITGAPNEPITFTCEFTADKVAETTVTPALSAVASQKFPLNLAKFYVDTSVANWGNTQKTGLLRAFTWTLETMFTARYGTDGSLTFTGVNEDKKKVDLELTYYRDATSEAEKDKYDARTTTYLRIALEGATELDSGQSNVPYIYLDGAYRYTEWPEMDDEDGTSVESVTAESVYDATGAKEFSVKVLTELASYPV